MSREILHILIDPEVKAAIIRLAKSDGRSMANYIERVLRAHVVEKDNG